MSSKNPKITMVIVMADAFGKWWSKYESRTRNERIEHFNTLPKSEQLRLKESFLKDGWTQLFCQNYIDEVLDYVKDIYGIDLVDAKIQAVKFERVYLIERKIWEDIEQLIFEYDPLYNSDVIFGGLRVELWGRRHQFYRISSRKLNV